jgi:hypothetical protein
MTTVACPVDLPAMSHPHDEDDQLPIYDLVEDAPKTGTSGSAAVVEGDLVAVGVREREGAAERPVDGR